MDRLKQLDVQRQQLELLRERTFQYAVNENALAQKSNIDKVEMVDSSVQTETAIENEVKKEIPTISYDKGIQTEFSEEPLTQLHVQQDTKPQVFSQDTLEDTVNLKTDIQLNGNNKLKPLTIKETTTLAHKNTNETFAANWYSKGGDTTVKLEHNQNFKSLHSWALPKDDLQNITFDMDSNRKITTIIAHQLHTPYPVSIVYVIDIDSDTIIDQLKLLGHKIVKVNILRKFETHKIISILLITQMGETILYELSQDPNTNSTVTNNWQRNLISKKNHIGSREVRGFNEKKFRIITGDNLGRINLLNSLDLSNYRDVTTNLHFFKLLPINRNIILSMDSADDDIGNNNNNGNDSNEGKFVQYLNKLLIYDQIHITGIVTSPFDDDCLFVSDILGAIYKIFLNDVTNDQLQISKDNNKFIPQLVSTSINEVDETYCLLDRNLFHSQRITTMSMNKNGLLLSGSLDWTVILWDTKQNAKLNLIDLRTPILKIAWMDDCDCLVLTWSNFYLIEWINDFKYSSARENYKIKNDIPIKLFPDWERFIDFESITLNDRWVIGLMGNGKGIEYIEMS